MADFVDYLHEIMQSRSLTQRDLASRSGVNQGLLSQILSRQRLPAHKTVVKLAQAINMPDDDALRMAGLMHSAKKPDDQQPSLRELISRFGQLSDADQENVLRIVRSLNEMEQAEKRKVGKLKPKAG